MICNHEILICVLNTHVASVTVVLRAELGRPQGDDPSTKLDTQMEKSQVEISDVTFTEEKKIPNPRHPPLRLHPLSNYPKLLPSHL